MPRKVIEELEGWLKEQIDSHEYLKTNDLKRNRVYHAVFSVAYKNVLEKMEEFKNLSSEEKVTK